MSNAELAPSKNIIIQAPEGLSAVINQEGAYLESLTTPDGTELLFPRQDFDGKDRGGIPICAPVFGPGDKVGLAQHGFARNLYWENDFIADPSVAKFQLLNPAGQSEELVTNEYANLCMELTVSVGTDDDTSILRMSLRARNDSIDPIVFTPGFHPYFPTDDFENNELQISTDGSPNEVDLNKLDPAIILNDSRHGFIEFSTPTQNIKITNSGLTVPVVWTNHPESFLCIEPTAAGPVTSNESNARYDWYKIEPGMSQTYSMQINWTPIK